MPRVAVLMSGGVDSSAAALLLARDGCEVVGITARMWDRGSRCCDEQDLALARRVCHALGILHVVVDLRAEFEKVVVEPFRRAYMSGMTPNPCAVCNREIKFGRLFRAAMAYDCDLVATGHYAGLGRLGGAVVIREPASRRKSQTYFLALVDPGVLGRFTFPLEKRSKNEARAMLAEHGLEARSGESQDLCFVAGGRYHEYLETGAGTRGAGKLVDAHGNVVGTHRGHYAYTIGQRLGYRGKRAYVLDKRPATDEVVVGDRELAMTSTIAAREANWFVDPAEHARGEIMVKYRYNTPAVSGRIRRLGDGTFEVTTREPCFAPAPGQIVACYKDGFLLGGGVIARTAGRPT